jgi:hypothetical protein
VTRILFLPFNIVGGIVAGLISKKAFEGLWRVLDNEEAPDPKHRQIDSKKLVAALVLEGAIVRAVRGIFDHGARRAFSKLTGIWPGEERPDPA